MALEISKKFNKEIPSKSLHLVSRVKITREPYGTV